jgi:hypothetical protein
MRFAVVLPAGVNVKLFVRLIVSPPDAVVGTVITTGDHPVVALLSGAQVAEEPVTAVPQL